ncbi:MAG: outer membrane beta-barrel protein [Planctomycetota bacterium]
MGPSKFSASAISLSLGQPGGNDASLDVVAYLNAESTAASAEAAQSTAASAEAAQPTAASAETAQSTAASATVAQRVQGVTKFSVVWIGFVWIFAAANCAHAQSFASFSDQTTTRRVQPKRDASSDKQVQTANFQSSNHDDSSRVQTVAYQQSVNQQPANQQNLNQRPARTYLPQQYQPTPALARQVRESYASRVANRLAPPARLPNASLPRSRQEDPFGDQQKPPVAQPRPIANPQPIETNPRTTPTNQLDPFGDPVPNQPMPAPVKQEDPFGEQQKPPVQNPNPNEFQPRQPPVQDPDVPQNVTPGQLPGVTEQQDPNMLDPRQLDPREPQRQDPVLPNDAQPNNITPQDPVRPPQGLPDQDPPDSDPRGDQGQEFGNGRPVTKPTIDKSIEYYQGTPLPEYQDRSSNVYRPPEQPLTYENFPPEYEVGPMATPIESEPYFVPAFEPIPGIVPAQQAPVYTQPRLPQPHSVAVPQIVAPRATPMPQQQVYSQVVNQCEPCQSSEPYGGCVDRVSKRQLWRGGFLQDWISDDCEVSQDCEQTCPSFYFAFQGGWNDLQNMINRDANELETETGSMFTFALGRMNGRNLRTEIELAIRNNDISDLIEADMRQGISGDVSSFSGMANAYWEFVDFPGGRFRPYVGFGVGFASLDAGLIDSTGASILTDEGGEDTSFAYQWMAGMNYKASCNMDLFVEYRFFEADALNLDTTNGSYSGNYNYQSNSVCIGLRWKF